MAAAGAAAAVLHGGDAWRIPLKPTPAQEPQMVKGRFLRGANAIVYALSKAVALDEPKADDRGSLLAGMEGRILAMSSLRAVDTSRGSEGQQSGAASQGRKPERRPQQP